MNFETKTDIPLMLVAIICGILIVAGLKNSDPILFFGPFIIGPIIMTIIIFVSSGLENKRKSRQEQYRLDCCESLDDAYALSPTEFEKLVAHLFKQMGYKTRLTPQTGDDGIDLILTKDNATELVQCKRYSSNISVKVVREFYGVVIDKRASKGYIVTTSNFTMPAIKFAQGKPIQLIDGAELSRWMVDLKKSIN